MTDVAAYMRRALGLSLRGLIWLYRHSLSCFLGRQCRFMPTCSAYASEAIRIHGPVGGTRLAVIRFCRCHPWGGEGFDPVPGIGDQGPGTGDQAPKL